MGCNELVEQHIKKLKHDHDYLTQRLSDFKASYTREKILDIIYSCKEEARDIYKRSGDAAPMMPGWCKDEDTRI